MAQSIDKSEVIGPPSVESAIRWNIVIGPIVLIGNLALIALAVKVGGSHAYGVWAICSGTVSLLGQADLGFGTAIVSQLARLRAEEKFDEEDIAKRYAVRVFLGVAVVLPAGLALGLLLYFRLFSPDLQEVGILIALACISLTLTFASRYCISLVQSHGIFHVERILSLAGLLLRAMILAAAFFASAGILAVAASDFAALVLLFLGSAAYCHLRKIFPSIWSIPSGSAHIFRGLYRLGVPTFVSGFATILSIQFPLYFVGAIVGYSEATAFSALTRILVSARAAFGWVTGPSLPEISQLSAVGKFRLIASKNAKSMLILAYFAGMVVSPMIVVGGDLFSLWLGPGYSVYGPAVAVSGIAIFAYALFQPSVVFAVALGHPRIMATQSIALLILTTVQSAYLPRYLGVMGGALAIAIPVVCLYPNAQIVASRVTGLRWLWATAYCVGGLTVSVCIGLLSVVVVDQSSPSSIVRCLVVVATTSTVTTGFAILTRRQYLRSLV